MGILAYLGAWITTISGVWFLFEKADETLAPEVRERLGAWLEKLSPEAAPRRWSGFFVALFDRTFGTRHLSWFCFRRSVAATFLLTWIVGAAWMAAHPPPSLRVAGGAFFLVTLAGIAFSVLPDYLSLLETRWVLGRLSRGAPTLVWLGFDAAATTVLGLAPYLLFAVVTEGAASPWEVVVQLVTFEPTMAVSQSTAEGLTVVSSTSYAMPTAPLFYATFFTSAWVWLFAASGLVVRATSRVLSQAARLRSVLDVRRKPGRALGLAAVLLVTLLYLGGVPVWMVLRAGG